jgi:hypothetical protein
LEFAKALAAVRWQSSGPVTTSFSTIATETQLATNWCWLATAASVDRFHSGTTTQCSLANQLLKQTTCCQSPGSVDCNRTGGAEDALTAIGRFGFTSSALYGQAPALSDVQDALEASQPPIAQLELEPGREHVVLLAGHGIDAAGNPFVRVGDPAEGWNPTDVIWAHASYYRSGVRWTYTHWTT